MKTFTATLLASVASATVMTKLDFDYMRFVSMQNKFYDTVEQFNMRKELFSELDTFISEANARGTLYTAGHNQFSDWTQDEKDKLLGLKGMPMPEVDMDTLRIE